MELIFFKANFFKNIQIPLFLSKVSAGFPSPAEDYIEKSLDLYEYVLSKPEATYFLKASGNSMIEQNIFDGDVLVVDRSKSPKIGDVIIASVDGEMTVKTFGMIENQPALIPANPEYKPILVQNKELEVWGVVTFTIHKQSQ